MHVCSDVVSERGCKYLDLGPGLKVGPDGRKLMGEICRSRDGYFQFSCQGGVTSWVQFLGSFIGTAEQCS